MKKKTRIAILLIAGKSERFLKDPNHVRKQFYPLHGTPLFLYPLTSLVNSGLFEEILLVHEKEDRKFIERCLQKKGIDRNFINLIAGGKDRNESVYQALEYLKEERKDTDHLVLFLHDGARACLPISILKTLDSLADDYDAITPVIPVNDSLIRGENYVSRENLYRVQTPQVIDFASLYQAYQNGYADSTTDDYSKIIKSGGKTTTIQGDPCLFKVTYPEDLKIMEKLISE